METMRGAAGGDFVLVHFTGRGNPPPCSALLRGAKGEPWLMGKALMEITPENVVHCFQWMGFACKVLSSCVVAVESSEPVEDAEGAGQFILDNATPNEIIDALAHVVSLGSLS